MAAMRSKAITLMWPLGRLQQKRERERESVVKVVENAAQQMPSRPPGTCLSISRPAAARQLTAARPINYSLSEIVCKVRSAIKIRGRIGTSQLLRQWRV